MKNRLHVYDVTSLFFSLNVLEVLTTYASFL